MRSYYLQINEYLQKLIRNTIIHDKKGILLKGTTLSIAELFILKILGKDRGKKMFEVIQELDIDRNSFVTLISKLQQQQLIIKTKSAEDKRVHILSLTDKGKEVYHEILQNEKDILEVLLNDFSFNEEKAVLKFLVKLDMLNKEKTRENEIQE
ncbi:DNA-binding transcriptional regulator, MarR family [Anaerovirgula multivorans]|uniref:HTH-type transcriptional regulator SarZ n=1 Tax=Anaerovirgula multivorans TaxID=312168 RepID=A0A239HUB5_9FIRM|nr:winged helix DNA-binding protein [Anaerovirgula multivorans]SNS84373.1 DNA-binding transcriptional regulator, MarR family [Anaerovirgula multivorans]